MGAVRERLVVALLGLALVAVLIAAGVHSTVARQHADAVADAATATAALESASTGLATAIVRGDVAAVEGGAIAAALAPLPDRLAGLVDGAATADLVSAIAALELELARVDDAAPTMPAPSVAVVDPDAGTNELHALAEQSRAATPAVIRASGIADSSARRVERASAAAVDALIAAAATAAEAAADFTAANSRATQATRDALTAAAAALADLALDRAHPADPSAG